MSKEKRENEVLRILLDENIDGYAGHLCRFLNSSTWSDTSSFLAIKIVTFSEVGLAKGTSDEQLWEFCQQHQFYLLTDNRNHAEVGSLESMIQMRTTAESVPVFTISDVSQWRNDRQYGEKVVVRLLEYHMDAEKIYGVGRLYLP